MFQTDKLLNPIQYYSGDFGIGTCPEIIVSFNYAIYGCDNIRGVVWRLSNDGLTPISILYKVNSWANRELILWKKGQMLDVGFAWPWLKDKLYGSVKEQAKFKLKVFKNFFLSEFLLSKHFLFCRPQLERFQIL